MQAKRSNTVSSQPQPRGRPVVLCTTNGTAILERVRTGAHVLVGALRNARACAMAAYELARGGDRGIQVVCAGRNRRFAAEDAVAAGVIVARLVEILGARGETVELTDAAAAAVRLRESFPDLPTAMQQSGGGATLRRIGQTEDIAFCAQEDASATVPVLRIGPPMRIVRLMS
jgi:2-phosphosulfolactate phosphatase